MNTGFSIIVFRDGGMRTRRGGSQKDHDTALQAYDPEDIFTHLFSPDGDPPSVVLEIAEETPQ